MANQYKNKVVYNGATLIDLSDTTAVQSDVASGKYFYLATGEKVEGTASGGGDEPVSPTYETIVPLQTINCTVALSNGAYGGYIANYTEYTSEGQKYRVIFDGTEYTPLTAAYYGGTTNFLYVGDANVEASSSATLTYPFEVVLYGGQTFYLGVKGSGTHTLQVDKITSEGSGGSGGDTASNPLKGKIATFTGDSICQGAGYAGGYAKIIGEDYDMTVENIGVSDGTVVNWQNKFCISESIADMRSDADFVMLEGGGNDADWGPQYIPVGTLSSGYNATLDTTTFAGAFETMLKSAINKFSNAKIGYIFVHKCIAAFDAPSGAYHSMAVSALEKWGIPYLDLNVMIPPLGYIDDLKNTYTRGDGIHPNELGYRTFYVPKIVAFMQSMITEKNLINKTVTTNGTYLASDDDADGYDSVTVNVSGGGSSKNVQIAQGVDRVATTTYTAVSGQSITVATTGTYDIYWTGYRSSTSGTSGSQLYIDSSEYGSAQTTFSNNAQSIHLTGVSLTQGQVVTVRARARNTTNYMYVGNLTIVQTA